MASTTKIMTCILALDMGDLDDLVTASSCAASQPKVHMGVKKGEKYLLKDLLYGLMLESYNDAAVMIAEHIGGTGKDFARLMNKKAEDLGCRDTWFITPNGLDANETDEKRTDPFYYCRGPGKDNGILYTTIPEEGRIFKNNPDPGPYFL